MIEKEIHNTCEKYGIKNYTINEEDMSIDVDGDVDLSYHVFDKIPIKFNEVNGNFITENNNLKSLINAPAKINGSFFCINNKLLSLKYSPKEVNGNFTCRDNELTSFEGMPSLIKGYILCQNNNIKSFKGFPEDYINYIICVSNPIYEIYKLFNNNSKCIYWLNEFDVIQGDNIIMDRLEEIFHELDMPVPDIKEIKGYKLI